MIEVLLALAVIAVGMTSVLGLFPVGLKASRQAVAENCSADVANQMVTYMRVMGEVNQTQYAKAFYDADSFSELADVTISDGELPSKTGSDNEKKINEVSETFLEAYTNKRIENNTLDADGTIDFKRVANRWAVFNVDGLSNNMPRIFFIVQGHNCTENDISGEDKISRPVDYSAMALVWKETVQIKRLEPDGSTWSNWPSDTVMSTGTDAEKYQYSGKLNVELSWPLQLPYKSRKKRYYQVVINKP